MPPSGEAAAAQVLWMSRRGVAGAPAGRPGAGAAGEGARGGNSAARAWRLGVEGPGGRKLGGERVRIAPLKERDVGRAGTRPGEAKGASGLAVPGLAASAASVAGAAPAGASSAALRLVLLLASFSFLVRHLGARGEARAGEGKKENVGVRGEREAALEVDGDLVGYRSGGPGRDQVGKNADGALGSVHDRLKREKG